MAIRTKEECRETSISQKIVEICETVPIIDWRIYLQNAQLSTSNNPTTFVQNVQVPELQYIYPLYDSFRFKLQISNSSSENWCVTSSPKLSGEILNLLPGENTDLSHSFQHLDLLPNGIVEIMMKIRAYGVKNGVETELENETITGTLKMSKSNSSGTTISTNREVFNLNFNLANNQLSGDREIIIYSKSNVGWEDVPFGLNVNKTENSTTTILVLNLSSTEIISGSYSEQMILKADNRQKRVTINLTVTNDPNQFYVDPQSFDFNLDFNSTQKASGTASVTNPNGLTITLDSFPNFLQSCNFNGSQITFQSKSVAQLGVGLFSGNIVLKAGSVTKNIFVKINVHKHLVNEFSGEAYYFALDKRKVELTRINTSAIKVYMKLDMFFLGYNQAVSESQTYQLPYFLEKATFYPGDEVNDFFVKQRALQSFQNHFSAYQFAVVKMTFSEIDDADNVISSFVMDNVRFAPGYTPKCFPFFTDFPLRSIYQKSRPVVSGDQLTYTQDYMDFLQSLNTLYGFGYNVRSYCFSAEILQAQNEIVDFGELAFVPIPESQKVINIFFETHNLVFDWFSCNGSYELPKDFEHTISDNVKPGAEEKFDTKENQTISISTGWILDEEVEIVDAIFNSNFCILQLPEKTVRAIPISKKNNLKSSQKGFKSMMLEFKILKDER